MTAIQVPEVGHVPPPEAWMEVMQQLYCTAVYNPEERIHRISVTLSEGEEELLGIAYAPDLSLDPSVCVCRVSFRATEKLAGETLAEVPIPRAQCFKYVVLRRNDVVIAVRAVEVVAWSTKMPESR